MMKKINIENYAQNPNGIFLPEKKFILCQTLLGGYDFGDKEKVVLNRLCVGR